MDSDIQLESCAQDETANLLVQLETWLAHSLSGEIKSRQTGSGPAFNAYSYVEIPEWSMRQKLADVQKARILNTRVFPSEAKLLEDATNALNNVARRVVGGYGGCWCVRRGINKEVFITTHDTDCAAAHEVMTTYDGLRG